MNNDQRSELVTLIREGVETFCADENITEEEAWRNLGDLVMIKLHHLRGKSL